MSMKHFRLIIISLLILHLASCGSTPVKPTQPIKSVAVVSIAVTAANLIPSVHTEPLQNLLNTTSEDLVSATEEKLSTIMQVRKVEEFIANPAYREAGVAEIVEKNESDYMTPRIKGQSMILFSKDDAALVDGILQPETARQLCANLKVDGVVLIYSEWAHDSKGFVPMQKAYTTNIFSVWDAYGVQVFKERIDTMGDNYVGPPLGHPIFVGRNNINEWSIAYSRALDEIVLQMQRLTH